MTGEPPKKRKRIVLSASYASLLEAGEWRPIPGCPGRSILQGSRDLTPKDLLGSGTRVEVFQVEGAPDPVHVAKLSGGGLISYAKPDGTFVHTLNTPDGFARKIADLGLDPLS